MTDRMTDNQTDDTDQSNRTVHFSTSDMEIARYARGKKWFLEPKGNAPRQQVTISSAIGYAVWAMKEASSPRWHEGRKGGSLFDQRLADALARSTRLSLRR